MFFVESCLCFQFFNNQNSFRAVSLITRKSVPCCFFHVRFRNFPHLDLSGTEHRKQEFLICLDELINAKIVLRFKYFKNHPPKYKICPD